MQKTDRELLEDALHALELWSRINAKDLVITQKIRARLAEKDDEPVAWSSVDGYVYRSYTVAKHSNNGKEPLPLYRHPRQPVWLTDDEVKQVIKQTIPDVTVSESVTFRAIARAIQAAVLEKNQ